MLKIVLHDPFHYDLGNYDHSKLLHDCISAKLLNVNHILFMILRNKLFLLNKFQNNCGEAFLEKSFVCQYATHLGGTI